MIIVTLHRFKTFMMHTLLHTVLQKSRSGFNFAITSILAYLFTAMNLWWHCYIIVFICIVLWFKR